MTSLIWKELRENVKWLPIPIVLMLGPTALLGPHNPMDLGRQIFAGMIAAVFGAVLGYLQVYPESRGDKRSLLLHRPLSRSRTAHGGVDLAVRRSYRSGNRTLVKYGNDTKPGNENWWYVPDQGWLVGYDKFTKRPIGSFGPDGFAPAGKWPAGRFEGPLFHYSNFPEAMARAYLAFPQAVYRVDFGTRSLHTLYVPSRGQTVLWASRWEDERQKAVLAFVGTDMSVDCCWDLMDLCFCSRCRNGPPVSGVRCAERSGSLRVSPASDAARHTPCQ
jgi:hypothetical protein